MKTNTSTLSFDITDGDYSISAEDNEGRSVISIKEKGTEIIHVEEENFFNAYIKALEELDKIEESRNKEAVTPDLVSDREDNSDDVQKENQEKDRKIELLENQIDELRATIDVCSATIDSLYDMIDARDKVLLGIKKAYEPIGGFSLFS